MRSAASDRRLWWLDLFPCTTQHFDNLFFCFFFGCRIPNIITSQSGWWVCRTLVTVSNRCRSSSSSRPTQWVKRLLWKGQKKRGYPNGTVARSLAQTAIAPRICQCLDGTTWHHLQHKCVQIERNDHLEPSKAVCHSRWVRDKLSR